MIGALGFKMLTMTRRDLTAREPPDTVSLESEPTRLATSGGRK
jgi:hypothetical protein